MSIILILEPSDHGNKPNSSSFDNRDIVIEIPAQGTLEKLKERYYNTSVPMISKGKLTPEEKSGLSFTRVEFNLLEENQKDRRVILLWIEERNEWIAITYKKWEEEFFHEETYRGPYEIGDFGERKLLEAYGIAWQRITQRAVRNTSPEDFIKEIISHAYSTNSTDLNICGKSIEELPPEIGELKNLRTLNVYGNLLKSLPLEIGKLQKLERLNIWFNQLSTLPSSIRNLRKLISLNAWHNQITLLPGEIGELINLEMLKVSSNKLNKLPNELFRLQNLVDLDINGNQFTELPQDFKRLTKLTHLDIRGNPLPVLPPEILIRTFQPRTILNYYFSIVEQKRKPINQIKLILVGQGSVGKTSLIQRILYSKFNPNQTKTEGISINQWTIDDGQQTIKTKPSSTVNGQSSIKLNIWDFGGQEIMHATHQFFLTKRSLYLLVLDARLTQEENRVEYWLKIIQSFGGESPVLIVGNKTDQHPLDIDRTGLQKKYPNIVGILETSAVTGAGIETLKDEIAKQVDTLPHVRDLLPETWFTVKSKLEELGRDKNFVTQDEYLSLCGANDVADETSQHTLIGFLHDLGVVLHFQDDPRLEALGILNPQWVTNGVYKILNSHELFQNQGTLTLPILNKTLNPPEYPRDKRLFIVDMMKKFELCYDIEPDKSFLIPDLLPKDEPYTGEWDGALAFQYHYNVLPSSIISRFIVRMNAFIHKTIWRSGVVLKSGGNTALVKADTEDRKIYIWVSGDDPTRRDLLSAIRMEFSAIHKTIAKIEVAEKVPHPDYPDLVLDYEELIAHERENIPTFTRKVATKIVTVDVKRLLAGVEGGESAEVFVSYAHADAKFVKKLVGDMKKAGISIWQDSISLEGGDVWVDEMERGLLQCKICLVVLSPDSVDSKWVKKEYTFAETLRKTIVPVRYKECDLPFLLNNIQYVDFTEQEYKKSLAELVARLKKAK